MFEPLKENQSVFAGKVPEGITEEITCPKCSQPTTRTSTGGGTWIIAEHQKANGKRCRKAGDEYTD